MEKDRCDEWIISSDSAGDRYLCDKGLSPALSPVFSVWENDRERIYQKMKFAVDTSHSLCYYNLAVADKWQKTS